MRKNIVACAVLLLASASAGKAQQVGDTEFSVWTGGGLSTLSYKLREGSTGLGGGIFGGVGYTTFFAPNFGVKFGMEVMPFFGHVEKFNFRTPYDIINPNGTLNEDTAFFLVDFRGFKEKQSAYYLNVPIMAHYQRDKFFASLGAKVGFGLNSTFSGSADTIATGAYAGDVDYVYWNLPEYGFGTYKNPKTKGNLDLGINVALSAEFGLVWRVNKLKLYTGVYADYGITNLIRGKDAAPAMVYDPSRDHNTFNQSIINTQSKTSQRNATNFVDRVSATSIGIKVAMSISTKSKSVSAEPTDELQLDSASVEEYEVREVDTVQWATLEQIRELLARLAAAESALAALEAQHQDGQSQKLAIENSEAQIRELLARLAATEEALEALEAQRKEQTAKAQPVKNVPNAARAKEITFRRLSAQGLRYKIQVAAYGKPLANMVKEYAMYDFFYDVEEEVEMVTSRTRIYKYVTGEFTHVDEARKELLRIRRSGLYDAFLVAYYNGERITISEANKITAGRKK